MRVSALRRALQESGQRGLPSDRLVTRTPGYLLRVDPDELDAYRFERLLSGYTRTNTHATAEDHPTANRRSVEADASGTRIATYGTGAKAG